MDIEPKELVEALRHYFDDVPLVLEAADAIEELQLYADLYKDLTAKGEKVAREVIDKYPKWIHVTERLPEDESDILAVQGYCGEVRIVPANYDRGVWYDCLFNRVAEHITHWMPLPEPPKEE